MNLLVGLWKRKKLWISGKKLTKKFGGLNLLYYICVINSQLNY